MIIAVGPLVMVLGAILGQLWDVGWVKPHEAYKRLKTYLLDWAGEDKGIAGDVPDRQVLRSRGADTVDLLNLLYREQAPQTSTFLTDVSSPAETPQSRSNWVPRVVDERVQCPFVDWERMTKQGSFARVDSVTAAMVSTSDLPAPVAVDLTRLCPLVDWEHMVQCPIEDTPKVLLHATLDASRFCVIVNPELEFMCAPEPPEPSQHHEEHIPVNNRQAFPFLVGIVSLVVLLLFVSGLFCWICGFNTTLARILNFLRFMPVWRAGNMHDRTHGLHEGSNPSDVLFESIMAPVQADEAEALLGVAVSQEVTLLRDAVELMGTSPDWLEVYQPSQSMVFLPESNTEDDTFLARQAEAVNVLQPSQSAHMEPQPDSQHSLNESQIQRPQMPNTGLDAPLSPVILEQPPEPFTSSPDGSPEYNEGYATTPWAYTTLSPIPEGGSTVDSLSSGSPPQSELSVHPEGTPLNPDGPSLIGTSWITQTWSHEQQGEWAVDTIGLGLPFQSGSISSSQAIGSLSDSETEEVRELDQSVEHEGYDMAICVTPSRSIARSSSSASFESEAALTRSSQNEAESPIFVGNKVNLEDPFYLGPSKCQNTGALSEERIAEFSSSVTTPPCPVLRSRGGESEEVDIEEAMDPESSNDFSIMAVTGSPEGLRDVTNPGPPSLPVATVHQRDPGMQVSALSDVQGPERSHPEINRADVPEAGSHKDLPTPQLSQVLPLRTRKPSSSRIPAPVPHGTRAARPMGPNVHKRVVQFQRTSVTTPAEKGTGSHKRNSVVSHGKRTEMREAANE